VLQTEIVLLDVFGRDFSPITIGMTGGNLKFALIFLGQNSNQKTEPRSLASSAVTFGSMTGLRNTNGIEMTKEFTLLDDDFLVRDDTPGIV
jgi:hypothetical protein